MKESIKYYQTNLEVMWVSTRKGTNKTSWTRFVEKKFEATFSLMNPEYVVCIDRCKKTLL